MVSSRITFHARKIRRRDVKCTLSALRTSGDTGAADEKNCCSAQNVISEEAATNAIIGSEAIDPENSELPHDSVGRSAGTNQGVEIGEIEDAACRTKQGAGKRKRKSRGRDSGSVAVVSKSVVTPLVAKDIKLVEEELESIAPTSLFAPGVLAAAVSHLKKCDPKLRAVIEEQELPNFPKYASAFSALVRSIVYQQLATKAASAILKRLLNLCGGDAMVTPSTILELPVPELRNVGISLRKASYLHDLARTFAERELTDASIALMEDAALMSTLTAVKGIGTWSVHMFMIFSLHRPDVLPVGDLGVRKGFQKLYNLSSLPSTTKMEELAAPWRPFRTLGSWYMWRLMAPTVPMATSKEETE